MNEELRSHHSPPIHSGLETHAPQSFALFIGISLAGGLPSLRGFAGPEGGSPRSPGDCPVDQINSIFFLHELKRNSEELARMDPGRESQGAEAGGSLGSPASFVLISSPFLLSIRVKNQSRAKRGKPDVTGLL